MKSASTMLSIGSKYQNDKSTLINSWDMIMDMANMVEIRVFMTSNRIDLSRIVL